MPETSLAPFLEALRRGGFDASAHESVADFLFLAEFWPLLRKPSIDSNVWSREPDNHARLTPEPQLENPYQPLVAEPKPKPLVPPDDVRQIYPVAPSSHGPARTASKIDIPGAPALRNPLWLARALRPFGRRFPSAQLSQFDEEATAELSASQRHLTLVFRPVLERWFDLIMVVDDVPSMAIWKKTIQEFERLLGSHGAFRDVRRVQLRMSGDRATILEASGRSTDPRSLNQPDGRRLILIFTHGVDGGWSSASLALTLLAWGAKQPIAIVSMLPKYQWEQTTLGEPDVRMRSPRPALPNALCIEERPAWQALINPGGQAVPILSLEPESLRQWSNMVMAQGSTDINAVHFSPAAASSSQYPSRAPAAASLSPEIRIGRFRANASPAAYRLVTALAGSPLTLPIMRLVQQTIFPTGEIEQVHLAEVLLSGLLERVHQSDDPETDAFDFLPGVRVALAQSLDLLDRLNVREQVFNYIRQHPESNLYFPALFPNKAGTHLLPAWAEPFAEDDQDLLSAGMPQSAPLSTLKREFTKLLFLLQAPARNLTTMVVAAGSALAARPNLPGQVAHEGEDREELPLRAVARSDKKDVETSKPLAENESATSQQVAAYQLSRRLANKPGNLRRIAWSPDGFYVAAGGFDEKVHIWDARTGGHERTFSGHTQVVYAVCWSPDGTRLASGSGDGTVRIWIWPARRLERELKPRRSGVLALAWSPSGTYIAAGTNDGSVLIWDVTTAVIYLDAREHGGPVHSVAWSRDGQRLASGSNDKTVRVWEFSGGAQKSTINRFPGQVYGVAYSPDGSLLAACGGDGTIRLWSQTGKQVGDLKGHALNVTDLAFSPNSTRLASISWDDTVRIWNVRSHTMVYSISVKSAKRFHEGLAFRPSGGNVLACLADSASAIEIWQHVSTAVADEQLEVEPTSTQEADLLSQQNESPTQKLRVEDDAEAGRILNVLVVGTGSFELPRSVQLAAEQVGAAVANSNANLITGGWPGVDHLAARWFSEAQTGRSGRPVGELVQIVEDKQIADFRGGKVERVGLDEGITECLRRADLVILVGGAGGTWLAFLRALETNKLILPFLNTGSDAQHAAILLELFGQNVPLALVRADFGNQREAGEAGRRLQILLNDLKTRRATHSIDNYELVWMANKILPLADSYLAKKDDFEGFAASIYAEFKAHTLPEEKYAEMVLAMLPDASPSWRSVAYLAIQAKPLLVLVDQHFAVLEKEVTFGLASREIRPLWRWLIATDSLMTSCPSKFSKESGRSLENAQRMMRQRSDVDPGGECKARIAQLLRKLGELLSPGGEVDDPIEPDEVTKLRRHLPK